jgi:uncharacterized membrane protein (DUF2068 family)
VQSQETLHMRALPLPVAIAMLLLAILSLTDFLPLALALLVVGKPTALSYLLVVMGVLGLIGARGLWMLKRWAMWLVIVVCVLNILISLNFLINATEIVSLAMAINSAIFIVLFALVIVLVVLPNSRRAYT